MSARRWIGRGQRASARRVYQELLGGLAWARDPAGSPLDDRAWTEHVRLFRIDADVFEAVDWAYDTLRDAGPPVPETPRCAAVRGLLMLCHPELFPDEPASGVAGAVADDDLWYWIGAAVPDGLLAIASVAGVDAGRVNRDLADAIVAGPGAAR